MPPAGAYITYSELFDTAPSWEGAMAIVRKMPTTKALVMLSRINTSLRFALQEHNRPNFGRLQQVLTGDFTDDETFRKLQERFPKVSTEERPIFLPISVLNVVRLLLASSSGLEPLDSADDPELRHLVGTACLMMNNLLLSADEERQIIEGEASARRLALLVQSLAPFELANPPAAHHLLFRYQIMFKTLLHDARVRNRIRNECRGFDFADEFERLAGIPLERWLHVVFSIYSYYLHGGNVFEPHLEFAFLDPNTFGGQSTISDTELNAVLKTLAGTTVELRDEIVKERITDTRFDLVPFRTRPLLTISGNRLICIDMAFVLEKLHTGVHWVMHDSYIDSRSRRDDLFKAWGILFEEYVHWLLRGMEGTNLPFYFQPHWSDGSEALDGLLMKDNVLMPLEYKGGFLARSARYSGKSEDFTKDVDEKFGVGCRQLAEKLGALFPSDNAQPRSMQDGPNLNHVRAVVPVLVLQDHILRVPFLNWYLNSTFQQELMRVRLRPSVLIRPLAVVSVDELETMVNSAEAAGFDLIYALHHRAVRDPEMISELQDFLMQFPDYGRQQSARRERVYKELRAGLFGYLFSADMGAAESGAGIS